MKKNNGIILIVLIITIIILIILVGVAISITVGENGLLSKVREAKEKYSEAATKNENSVNLR